MNIDVEYIAFDSFGVKSSCVMIEKKEKTKKTRILIDPGIAVEPKSFPLSKTKKIWIYLKYKKRIKKAIKKSDIIVITHYHYDHFLPNANYSNKILLIKNPEKKINESQRKRAKDFLNFLKKRKKIKIYFADSRKFNFNGINIEFSKPLWHGPKKTKLGYVIACTIKIGKIRIMHSSDIDGPIVDYSDYIIAKRPSLLFLDGAPTYLLGYIMSYKNLKKAIKNTIKIIKGLKRTKIILDHHLLRDVRYMKFYSKVYAVAKKLERKVLSAAEDLGEVPVCLSSSMPP